MRKNRDTDKLINNLEMHKKYTQLQNQADCVLNTRIKNIKMYSNMRQNNSTLSTTKFEATLARNIKI